VRTADFDFELPEGLIAQEPTAKREDSRLLALDRASGRVEHRKFLELGEYLRPGDALVLNDSRVIPARLRGVNAASGGQFDLLLLSQNAINDWWVMLRPGRRARVGTRIQLLQPTGQPTAITAQVIEINAEGHRRLRFSGTRNLLGELEALGEVPLPPYIRRAEGSRRDEDRERYQTVYARESGSVAAPTAGLHFTEALLESYRARKIAVCFLTLHVGLGTFAPVKSETLSGHRMHAEVYTLGAEAAAVINERRSQGGRIFAVGTTTVRVLESVAASHSGRLVPCEGSTRIFIHPPYQFAVVDGMVTNFHLPRSTLLMLVCAFAAPNEERGRQLVLDVYAQAVRKRYRFFSYGDAMLIL
jgi:S-adenosylmethionine:tRNA ribosyltransferase-isomerase